MVGLMKATATKSRQQKHGPDPIFGERHLFGLRLETPDAKRFKAAADKADLTYQAYLLSIVKSALDQDMPVAPEAHHSTPQMERDVA